MKFKIEICMDNDAFVEYPIGELVSVLTYVTREIVRHGMPAGLTLYPRDTNGNLCGKAWVEEDEIVDSRDGRSQLDYGR